jgi:hypothetical protein
VETFSLPQAMEISVARVSIACPVKHDATLGKLGLTDEARNIKHSLMRFATRNHQCTTWTGHPSCNAQHAEMHPWKPAQEIGALTGAEGLGRYRRFGQLKSDVRYRACPRCARALKLPRSLVHICPMRVPPRCSRIQTCTPTQCLHTHMHIRRRLTGISYGRYRKVNIRHMCVRDFCACALASSHGRARARRCDTLLLGNPAAPWMRCSACDW